MKPPRFEYHAPTTIDEAVALLARYGGDAKVLAGGQSLVPLLNFRLSRPAALIDVNRIAPLAYVREDNGTVALGAMTRQRTIEFSPLVARRLPPMLFRMLPEVEEKVPTMRTEANNLCNIQT